MSAPAAGWAGGGPRAALPPTLELVAFDFDGVLCDSVDVKTAAFRELYADVGARVQDALVAYHLVNGGISRHHKIRYAERELLHRPGDDAAVEARAARFAEIVVEQVIAAPMRPGALDCLQALTGVVPVAVVSGTPEDELSRIVAAKGLTSYLDAVHGAPVDKSTHLFRLLDRYNAAPKRSVMVGDAETDRAAALACGMPFLGIVGSDGTCPFSPDVRVETDLTTAIPALSALLGAPDARARSL